MIAENMAVAATGLALGGIAEAIKVIYGVTSEINDFINEHIELMKSSKNPTISRTGRVIEGAKFGFGIGYVVPVAIIATGQLLLGNTLSAVKTVATAATLTNPIAMTCAAVGAIYYGWAALSDVERNEILDKLSKGLAIGIELINSIIRFVIDKMNDLLDSKNMREIKKFIGEAAETFGRKLGDITKTVKDKVKDTFDEVVHTSENALDHAKGMAEEGYHEATAAVENAAKRIEEKLRKPKKSVQKKEKPALEQ